MILIDSLDHQCGDLQYRRTDPVIRAAWDMQAFWYNVTKAGSVKYGPSVTGNLVQIQRNGDGAV